MFKNNHKSNNHNDHEFCPRCEANLTLQKGFDRELPFWVCLGCGEMLINPLVDTESEIAWICDNCGKMLNIQPGFDEDCGQWECTECGYVNQIDESALFESEDERQAVLANPYRGLSDDEVLTLSEYIDEEYVDGRTDISIVRRPDSEKKFIRKCLSFYDKSIYEFIKANPISHMPRIVECFESKKALVVIEEYIEGDTIAELLESGVFSEKRAVGFVIQLCKILDTIHNLDKPIIHRDVKPSNVIISPNDEVFLLDMNTAKWYKEKQVDDTHYMGTFNYAAPEQMGYGMSASSAKTDIYAVGVLLNVMITGRLPKEELVPGETGKIIERCISLEPDERYTAKKLIKKLESAKEDL